MIAAAPATFGGGKFKDAAISGSIGGAIGGVSKARARRNWISPTAAELPGGDF
ncbi:hypothetical protein [Saccharopolyspora hattusasensis]|uniref:hypothetical protein n=1 Tax=Saccharopolyspora hattusasensis TaxID=1128679 RepID=UPI003D99C1D7